MTAHDLEKQRALSEVALKDNAYDFTAKYMAVSHLHSLVRTNPEVINAGTISALEKVIKDPRISRQTQAYFMYRETANTLCSMITHSKHLTDQALSSLKISLGKTSGHAHRAVAEALGALPFSMKGPDIHNDGMERVPDTTFPEVLKELDLTPCSPPAFIGRSLVTPVDQGDRLLVIKLARANESPASLGGELYWMEYLRPQSRCFDVRFNVPEAVKVKGRHVFNLQNIPAAIPHHTDLHPKRHAIGFIAHKDYFTYPNDTGKERQLTHDEFGEVISRNAYLMGSLTSSGIVHSAPIPLFHNRMQRERRRDHGLYEWPRAGRLDGWLDSCSYPNLGLTGIRDFEHLLSFKGMSRRLYIHIGTHFLGLLLVAGSYFRNKDRDRTGFDTRGRPVDARDLFDKPFLKELIHNIFVSYYHGFVGKAFDGQAPLDLETLSSRMIDEMGVDRHMEEILRVADQKEMTEEAFQEFLENKSFPLEAIRKLKKGIEDITIHSGPHLGGFNERISLPELIESVETMSALCIAGRYFTENL
jgi:hypothetical protein